MAFTAAHFDKSDAPVYRKTSGSSLPKLFGRFIKTNCDRSNRFDAAGPESVSAASDPNRATIESSGCTQRSSSGRMPIGNILTEIQRLTRRPRTVVSSSQDLVFQLQQAISAAEIAQFGGLGCRRYRLCASTSSLSDASRNRRRPTRSSPVVPVTGDLDYIVTELTGTGPCHTDILTACPPWASQIRCPYRRSRPLRGSKRRTKSLTGCPRFRARCAADCPLVSNGGDRDMSAECVRPRDQRGRRRQFQKISRTVEDRVT